MLPQFLSEFMCPCRWTLCIVVCVFTVTHVANLNNDQQMVDECQFTYGPLRDKKANKVSVHDCFPTPILDFRSPLSLYPPLLTPTYVCKRYHAAIA